ncbi:hypothetical protein IscW_ISCW005941 [Ixodes scapularis]|uniref:Uncharacterized protein n=1 Tax=Ixodes scapularis TaxID=6945 RepID=B7PM42_IXOSC|nr:hypothetical protein IscW_ISCW005941 [Ixodes scapularis]|eukprot:XP_002434840.1 hypothetical protein IscW_ISCW005941 [Ixodes scapularis]
MDLEQDNADFSISTVFDNGRLLVRTAGQATECSPVRVPGAYSATRCSTGRIASPFSELHPDRDSACPDCGDIEEYLLLRRGLYAPVRSAACSGSPSQILGSGL